jgi:hypothetical protein
MFRPKGYPSTQSFRFHFIFSFVACVLVAGMVNCGGADPDAADSKQYPRVLVTTTALPAATVGTPYAFKMTATGGSGADYLWAIQSGKIPDGLKFDLDGNFSGTPTTAGTVTLTFAVQHTCFCVPQTQPQNDSKAMDLVVH